MQTVTATTADQPCIGEDHAGTPGGDDRSASVGRVLVVEEHALIATGLQVALSARSWHVQTTSGPPEVDVIEHARRFQPDCVLLDVHLGYGSGNGFDLIRPLVATGAKVVMLTAERRRTILAECIEAGATGWIRTTTALDEVDATLSAVVAGEPILGRTERAELLELLRTERANALRDRARFADLTPREALVLGALADGRSAEEIAQQHFVALTTVRSQIRSVLQKLGVRSQLAAVAIADAHRWMLPAEVQTDRDRRRSGPVSEQREPALSTRSA
jgi:two-component system nitrate/nitrite response regulator NarL